MKTLYGGLIKPVASYAAAGWFDLTNERDRRKLKSKFTRAYRTASTDALCVLAGEVPISLLLARRSAHYRFTEGPRNVNWRSVYPGRRHWRQRRFSHQWGGEQHVAKGMVGIPEWQDYTHVFSWHSAPTQMPMDFPGVPRLPIHDRSRRLCCQLMAVGSWWRAGLQLCCLWGVHRACAHRVPALHGTVKQTPSCTRCGGSLAFCCKTPHD